MPVHRQCEAETGASGDAFDRLRSGFRQSLRHINR